MLINLQSLDAGDEFKKSKGLAGAAMEGTGRPPAEYGLKYIPHHVLVDAKGVVVKNFKVDLPKDLDELLAKDSKEK